MHYQRNVLFRVVFYEWNYQSQDSLLLSYPKFIQYFINKMKFTRISTEPKWLIQIPQIRPTNADKMPKDFNFTRVYKQWIKCIFIIIPIKRNVCVCFCLRFVSTGLFKLCGSIFFYLIIRKTMFHHVHHFSWSNRIWKIMICSVDGVRKMVNTKNALKMFYTRQRRVKAVSYK